MVEVKWHVCFWNPFCLLCLTATIFMKWFEVFKNNRIYSWQLSAYFYQISNKCYCLIFLIDLFTSTVLTSTSQKYKVRRNLEVPWKALFKRTLNEQNSFAIKMVSHSSHTNHEILTFVIRVNNVNFAIGSFATYEKGLIPYIWQRFSYF